MEGVVWGPPREPDPPDATRNLEQVPGLLFKNRANKSTLPSVPHRSSSSPQGHGQRGSMRLGGKPYWGDPACRPPSLERRPPVQTSMHQPPSVSPARMSPGLCPLRWQEFMFEGVFTAVSPHRTLRRANCT